MFFGGKSRSLSSTEIIANIIASELFAKEAELQRERDFDAIQSEVDEENSE